MDDAAITSTMEGALLGALLLGPELLPHVSGTLLPVHLSDQAHQAIYTAMLDRFGKGLPCDARTLAGDLHTAWNAPFVGETTFGHFVAGLMREAAPAMMLKGYAQDLRDSWALRAAHEAVERSKTANGMPADRLATLQSELDEVRASLVDIGGTREVAGDTGEALLQRLNDRLSGQGAPLGATTGWTTLDDVMAGYLAGQLIIVAGRPGMGKTTLATSSAWQCAAAGHGVQFFSLEMGREDLGARLLADITFNRQNAIHYSSIKAAHISDDQMRRLIEAKEYLARLPLELDYAARLSVGEIGVRIAAAKKRMAKRGSELRVAFVDYLKMVRATDRYKGNRTYEVAEITAGLREVAKREGVCIVLMCQLNREGEREGKRPQLHHLRESGDIEADADVVMFVYRQAYYVAQSPEYQEGNPATLAEYQGVKNQLEVITAKNRNGPTLTKDLFCDIAASAIRPDGPGYGEHRQ